MVEWKRIWEVTTWDKKFNGVEKSMQPKVIKYHYYLANELAELEHSDGDIRILYTTEKIAYTYAEEVKENISEGEIVAIPWGGNVSIKYYKGKFVTADNRIATSNDTDVLSNKYLFYWMLSQKDLIGSFYRGAGIKHPSMMSVLNMQIPIPSLEEQNRIVGILDTFMDSIENLKQQIAQRRKQHEHYRDQLLDLEGKEGVEMKTLEDCAILISDGDHQPPPKTQQGIPFITISNINKDNHKIDFSNTFFVPKEYYESIKNERKAKEGDVLYTVTGSYGIPVNIDFAKEFCFQRHIAMIRPNIDVLLSKFLYHPKIRNYHPIHD